MNRRNLVRFTLVLHRTTALATLAFILLYAITGLAMVHSGWLPGGRSPAVEREIAWPGATPRASDDAALVAAQARAAFGIRGRLEKAETDTDGWRLSFRRPGRSSEVTLEAATGRARLVLRGSTPARRLGELHELRRYEGRWPYRLWALLVDAVAVALVVFALSGVALWALLRPGPWGALLLAASSLYVLVSIGWLWLSP